ncbi:MAG: carboxypeptidase regulatory-like domain-containing protein [Syntrophobacteraceae bacterium]|nr:carboxypeptidase regulatory-like domain-containing protein [Syntrophobacteraceae bacterium]
MKKVLVFVVALAWVFVFSLDNASAKKPKPKFSPVERLSHSGDIKGTLDCGSLGPDSEAMIYIPGKSFVVKTPILTQDENREGKFRFYNVPAGVYDLIIEIPGQDPVTVPNVEVKQKKVTDVGNIPVTCPNPEAAE